MYLDSFSDLVVKVTSVTYVLGLMGTTHFYSVTYD